jgi:hypothetical protein
MRCNGIKAGGERADQTRWWRDAIGFSVHGHNSTTAPNHRTSVLEIGLRLLGLSLGRGERGRYNAPMQSHRYLPEAGRISVLMAAVLLAFALTRVLSTPNLDLSLPLPGIVLAFSVNLDTAIVILAAGLTATGVDWLLRSHPSLQQGGTQEHWLLPTLTVLVIGVALYTLPAGATWWVGFGLGGCLLLVVFLSEYVAVDPSDTRYPVASAMLTAISFTIFLILSVALRAANARLFLVLPALFLTGGLTALRTLHLRLSERWELSWAIGIAVVTLQLGAALHYWPLSPIRFGLILVGPIYALTVMAVSLAEGHPFRQSFMEPLVMLVLFWGMAVWFR